MGSKSWSKNLKGRQDHFSGLGVHGMITLRNILKRTSYQGVHSFSSLSYDRSKASSRATSPHSAIQSFLLQMRILSPFLKVIQQFPTSSSSSSCHFPPPFYLSFNNPLQKAVPAQNVTNPVSLPLFISCRILLCSLTVSNTSSFLTCWVQLIFSILLQHHISKHSTCF